MAGIITGTTAGAAVGAKVGLVNRLFDEWKEQRPEEAQCMCLDGIVCEARYEHTNPKILFIMKEPNHPEGPGCDFRE